jgi:hypothetical protein
MGLGSSKLTPNEKAVCNSAVQSYKHQKQIQQQTNNYMKRMKNEYGFKVAKPSNNFNPKLGYGNENNSNVNPNPATSKVPNSRFPPRPYSRAPRRITGGSKRKTRRHRH